MAPKRAAGRAAGSGGRTKAGPKAQAGDGVPVSLIRKVEQIERKVDAGQKKDGEIRREQQKLLRLAQGVEDEQKVTQNVVVKVAKGLERNMEVLDRKQKFLGEQQAELKKSEDEILQMEDQAMRQMDVLGKYSVKRKYYLELTRGLAGAFFGTGMAYTLVNIPSAASQMSLYQAVALLLLVLGFSFYMLYRNQKLWMGRRAAALAAKRTGVLFGASLAMGAAAIFITGAAGGLSIGIDAALRSMALGSFPAMAGAVLFVLTE
jgi:uncharacterized membrane protein